MYLTEMVLKVLNDAHKEATSADCKYIGTQHLLLALAKQNEGISKIILDSLDISETKIRDAIRKFRPCLVDSG